MIIIQDNFLSKETFKLLQLYANQEFKIHEIGDKKFSLLTTPTDLLDVLKLKGHDIVTSFIRSAYKGFDEDLRIHCDHYIDNKKIAFASVLYINKEDEVTKNGTCFYKHHKYGFQAPNDLSKKEFDRLLVEDANDIEKWTETDKISSRPNRLVIYNADLWHSKYPKIIEKGVRKVIVTFHAKSI